jgi:hypothetical protein
MEHGTVLGTAPYMFLVNYVTRGWVLVATTRADYINTNFKYAPQDDHSPDGSPHHLGA